MISIGDTYSTHNVLTATAVVGQGLRLRSQASLHVTRASVNVLVKLIDTEYVEVVSLKRGETHVV